MFVTSIGIVILILRIMKQSAACIISFVGRFNRQIWFDRFVSRFV